MFDSAQVPQEMTEPVSEPPRKHTLSSHCPKTAAAALRVGESILDHKFGFFWFLVATSYVTTEAYNVHNYSDYVTPTLEETSKVTSALMAAMYAIAFYGAARFLIALFDFLRATIFFGTRFGLGSHAEREDVNNSTLEQLGVQSTDPNILNTKVAAERTKVAAERAEEYARTTADKAADTNASADDRAVAEQAATAAATAKREAAVAAAANARTIYVTKKSDGTVVVDVHNVTALLRNSKPAGYGTESASAPVAALADVENGSDAALHAPAAALSETDQLMAQRKEISRLQRACNWFGHHGVATTAFALAVLLFVWDLFENDPADKPSVGLTNRFENAADYMMSIVYWFAIYGFGKMIKSAYDFSKDVCAPKTTVHEFYMPQAIANELTGGAVPAAPAEGARAVLVKVSQRTEENSLKFTLEKPVVVRLSAASAAANGNGETTYLPGGDGNVRRLSAASSHHSDSARRRPVGDDATPASVDSTRAVVGAGLPTVGGRPSAAAAGAGFHGDTARRRDLDRTEASRASSAAAAHHQDELSEGVPVRRASGLTGK